MTNKFSCVVEMQQFSCNLEPPDQGYLIINKGGGRERGAGTEPGF